MLAEAIFKGATRPAMKLGIPLVPLVALCGAGMLAVMWVGPLLTWWIVPLVFCCIGPLLVWIRFVTRLDDQRMRQMLLAARLRLRDRNRRLWHARSYAPYLFRGGRNVGAR